MDACVFLICWRQTWCKFTNYRAVSDTHQQQRSLGFECEVFWDEKKESCLISESRSKIPTGSLVCSVLLNPKTGQIRCKPNTFPVSAFSSCSSLVYLLLPGQERTRGQRLQPQTLEKPETFRLVFPVVWLVTACEIWTLRVPNPHSSPGVTAEVQQEQGRNQLSDLLAVRTWWGALFICGPGLCVNWTLSPHQVHQSQQKRHSIGRPVLTTIPFAHICITYSHPVRKSCMVP